MLESNKPLSKMLSGFFTNPLITVVIPFYNEERFLATTIQSIIDQTYSNWELIAIDDASTDRSLEIVKAFVSKDHRIRILEQSHQGQAAAKNLGFREAKGDYICLQDADDVSFPNRVELNLRALQENRAYDVVYSAVHLIDEEGKYLGTLRGKQEAPENFLAKLFFRNILPNPNTIFAKAECIRSVPYREDLLTCEDYDFTLRLAHRYRFYYLDLPLVNYRRHQKNITNDLAFQRKYELQIVKSYEIKHIKEMVNKTSLSKEEKALLLGKILYNTEQFSEAERVFAGSTSKDALFYVGNCCYYQDRFENAISHFNQAINKEPTDAACFNNLGVCLFKIGKALEAKVQFNRALQLRPNYLDAKKNLDAISNNQQEEASFFTFRELRKSLIPYFNSKNK